MNDSSADRSRIALSRDEMREFGYQVVDLLVEHFANVRNGPVGAKADPARMVALFDQDPPEAGRDPNDLLAQLERDVFPNNLHVDHPRFFAFVPGPNNFVSTMADALAAGFNIFNGTWFGGSAAAAVERGIIRWLCRLSGLPSTAGGLFVSGGSVANMTGLMAARHALLQDRVDGATIYFSDQTHSSVERALRVIGFGSERIRKLESDNDFRLSIQNLRGSIADDRAKGLRPFCIVANAGTTNTGAIDPLAEFRQAITRGFGLAEVAERELRARKGWEILSPAQMATVCFRFGKSDELQTQLVDEMMKDGYALLTSTELRGRACLRLCTINPRTTEEDIIETVRRLDKFARH